MRSHQFILAPTLLMSIGVVTASETPAQPYQLVDRVIPAYGAAHDQPYFVASSLDGLYHDIAAATGKVNVAVASGTMNSPGFAALRDLTSRLKQAEASLARANYLERWQINASYANLQQAAEQLLGAGRLTAAEYAQLHTGGVRPPARPEATPARVPPSTVPVAEEAILAPPAEPMTPIAEPVLPADATAPASVEAEAPVAEPVMGTISEPAPQLPAETEPALAPAVEEPAPAPVAEPSVPDPVSVEPQVVEPASEVPITPDAPAVTNDVIPTEPSTDGAAPAPEEPVPAPDDIAIPAPDDNAFVPTEPPAIEPAPTTEGVISTEPSTDGGAPAPEEPAPDNNAVVPTEPTPATEPEPTTEPVVSPVESTEETTPPAEPPPAAPEEPAPPTDGSL